MNHSIFLCALVTCALLAAAPPVHAQQPSTPVANPTSPPATDSPAATPADPAPAGAAKPAATTSQTAAPSASTLRKAKSLGLHSETRDGRTQYCWQDANVGSRFTTKKCVDESQLDEIIAQREAVREQMRGERNGTWAK